MVILANWAAISAPRGYAYRVISMRVRRQQMSVPAILTKARKCSA